MIHLGLFIVILLVSFVLLEAVNRSMISHLSYSAQTADKLEQNTDTVKILLLGDSHLRYAVDQALDSPEIINASFEGASYIQLYYFLENSIAVMPQLQTVVLSADLHSFSSYRSSRISDAAFWAPYIDWDDLRRHLGWITCFTNRYTLSLMNESLNRRLFWLKYLIRKWSQSGNGKPPVSKTASIDPVKSENRARHHFEDQELVDPVMQQYFERILQLCQKHSVRVLTIQTPVSQSYLKEARKYGMTPQKLRNCLEAEGVRNLISRDLDYLEMFQSENRYFRDSGDHLNEEGKKMFLPYLRRDLNL